MRYLPAILALFVLTMSAAATPTTWWETWGTPKTIKSDSMPSTSYESKTLKTVKPTSTQPHYSPDVSGNITPEWYYQKKPDTPHVTPLFELAGEIDMDAGLDCSIRGAFMEWAAESSGHHAMLCLKKIKEHSDGGWETHVYLKLDYPYKPIKGKHSHSYCYYDTLDGYTLVLDSEPDWEWFDSPTLTAETLDEFIYELQYDLELNMDYDDEFYWWERPEMMESKHRVEDYQHEYGR